MNTSPRQTQHGTKLYAVVGDPIAHSLSPLIHNRWIKAAAIDAAYIAIHLRSQNAVNDFRLMARDDRGRTEAGRGRYFMIAPPGIDSRVVDFAPLHGLNVTLPHKIAALEAGANSSPEARIVGAANTLVRDGETWIAHNTDVAGFEAAMRAAAGEELRNLNVLLIGAGGAARAAVVSLNRSGANLTIANRSDANAAALANELAPHAHTAGLEDIARLSAAADIIVNSASLGHAGDSLPQLAPGRGRPFLDLSYGKASAPTLAAAEAAGWAPHDGLVMLVAQAAAAFHLWFGIWPDQADAYRACRAAVAART